MNIASLASTLAAVALLVGVAGCTKPSEPIGPAQKAGAAIDQAGDRVGEKLKENVDKARAVGDTLAEAAKATGDKVEQATGDAAAKVTEATDDAAAGLNKATENVGKKVERAGEKIQEAARPK